MLFCNEENVKSQAKLGSKKKNQKNKSKNLTTEHNGFYGSLTEAFSWEDGAELGES